MFLLFNLKETLFRQLIILSTKYGAMNMNMTVIIIAIIMTFIINIHYHQQRYILEAKANYKEALINQTTNISCIPNKKMQIQWHHTKHGESSSQFVYAGGRFFEPYNKGFRLENDSNTGPYYLVILNARYEDAGLYECKDDEQSGVFGSTKLTVLGRKRVLYLFGFLWFKIKLKVMK